MYSHAGGWHVLFEDFERTILSMLPKNFPIYAKRMGLAYSKALMVVRLNELHDVRSTNRCMFEPISINLLNYGLGSQVKHGGHLFLPAMDGLRLMEAQ